mgnify:CR=1 FL=1
MDYSTAVTTAELTTNRMDSPGKLTFTVLGFQSRKEAAWTWPWTV